jgi:hypothetical protein
VHDQGLSRQSRPEPIEREVREQIDQVDFAGR